MSQDEFYKSEYFKQMDKRFDTLEEKLDSLKNELSLVKGKLIYVYAFSGGIAVVIGFIINILPMLNKIK